MAAWGCRSPEFCAVSLPGAALHVPADGRGVPRRAQGHLLPLSSRTRCLGAARVVSSLRARGVGTPPRLPPAPACFPWPSIPLGIGAEAPPPPHGPPLGPCCFSRRSTGRPGVVGVWGTEGVETRHPISSLGPHTHSGEQGQMDTLSGLFGLITFAGKFQGLTQAGLGVEGGSSSVVFGGRGSCSPKAGQSSPVRVWAGQGALQVWLDSSGAVPGDGCAQPCTRRPVSSICVMS